MTAEGTVGAPTCYSTLCFSQSISGAYVRWAMTRTPNVREHLMYPDAGLQKKTISPLKPSAAYQLTLIYGL
jgi:hypothetical protein